MSLCRLLGHLFRQFLSVPFADLFIVGEIQPPAKSLRSLAGADMFEAELVELVRASMPDGLVIKRIRPTSFSLLHPHLMQLFRAYLQPFS